MDSAVVDSERMVLCKCKEEVVTIINNQIHLQLENRKASARRESSSYSALAVLKVGPEG